MIHGQDVYVLRMGLSQLMKSSNHLKKSVGVQWKLKNYCHMAEIIHVLAKTTCLEAGDKDVIASILIVEQGKCLCSISITVLRPDAQNTIIQIN
jgi:hypothetical protein